MKHRWLLLAPMCWLLTACASQTIYYWGDYSNTLHQYNKSPSEQSLERHRRELERLIDQAERREKQVPPGLFFELAMLEVKRGNSQRAKALMQQEMDTYPESSRMVLKAMALIKD